MQEDPFPKGLERDEKGFPLTSRVRDVVSPEEYVEIISVFCL